MASEAPPEQTSDAARPPEEKSDTSRRRRGVWVFIILLVLFLAGAAAVMWIPIGGQVDHGGRSRTIADEIIDRLQGTGPVERAVGRAHSHLNGAIWGDEGQGAVERACERMQEAARRAGEEDYPSADRQRIARVFRELVEEAEKELAPASLPAERVERRLYANLCYPGQNFDMSVPVGEDPDAGVVDALVGEGALEALAERFHDLHEADHGYCFPNQPPLLRSLRLTMVGRTPQPERFATHGETSDAAAARTGSRGAYFGDGFVEAAVYDGPRLAAGAVLDGPALIEEPFTVVVVPPRQRASVDGHGNYDISATG